MRRTMRRSSRRSASTVQPRSLEFRRTVRRVSSMRSVTGEAYPGRPRFRFGHGGDDAVGEVVDEAHQEVPRAHRRVADAKGEDGLGRVQLRQRMRTLCLAEAAGRRLVGPLGEAIEPGLHQRLYRLTQHEADELGRREVAAGRPAHERIRADDDIVAVPRQLAFEESLVDRAELLHAEVPVVDVPAAGGGPLERQRVDDVGYDAVAQPDRAEQRGPPPVEQPAVVGRQADRRIALVDNPAQNRRWPTSTRWRGRRTHRPRPCAA